MSACFLYRSLSLAGVVCALALTGSGVTADPVLGFGRTAGIGVPGDIGYVDVYVAPTFSGTEGYLNVAADIDGNGSPDWLVQNSVAPMQYREFGQYSTTFSSTFDLGGLAPTGSYDVYASFTSAPMSVLSLGSMQLNASVLFSIYDIVDLQDGVLSGLDAGPGAVSSSDQAAEEGDNGPLGNGIIGRVRHDIPGIRQGNNECAPTSAAQSLYWLRDRQGLQGLPAQANLLDRLKKAMRPGWTTGAYPGIQPANFKPGKDKVVGDLKLPIVTKTGGQFNGTGTFNWVKGEIEADEDVELRIQYPGGGGHWVTVAGWYDNGTKKKLYFKDPLTGGNTVDEYELNGTTIKNYKYGAGATISFAVSESIIPEPGTFAALAMGIAGVVALRLKRRRA